MTYKIDTGFDPDYFDIEVESEEQLRDVVILSEYASDDPFVYLRQEKHDGFILCQCEGDVFCVEQKLADGTHYRLCRRLNRSETQDVLIEYFRGKRLSAEDSSWENVTDEVADAVRNEKSAKDNEGWGCMIMMLLWGVAAIAFVFYVIREAFREGWI